MRDGSVHLWLAGVATSGSRLYQSLLRLSKGKETSTRYFLDGVTPLVWVMEHGPWTWRPREGCSSVALPSRKLFLLRVSVHLVVSVSRQRHGGGSKTGYWAAR